MTEWFYDAWLRSFVKERYQLKGLESWGEVVSIDIEFEGEGEEGEYKIDETL